MRIPSSQLPTVTFRCGNQIQPATQVIFAPGEPTTLYAAGGGAATAQRFFVNPYDADEIYIVDTTGVRHSTDGDKLQLMLGTEAGGAVLETLTNASPLFQWRRSRFDLSAYRGQTVTVSFRASENRRDLTSFYLDDIRLDAHYLPRVYVPIAPQRYPLRPPEATSVAGRSRHSPFPAPDPPS